MTQYDNRQATAERLLTPREAAEYLRLNPRTVTRLAREGKLPAVKIGKRWRFRADALAGWSRSRAPRWSFEGRSRTAAAMPGVSITSMLRPEAVLCDLEAAGRREALEGIVSGLVAAGVLSEGELFLKLLFEREELMSTSIAEGVALPHPRRAIEGMFDESLVAVAISPRGVDFGSSSGVPVRVFFVICARDDRSHLRILARLSRLLLETPLVERLMGARFPEEVISTIAALERALNDGGRGGLIAG